MDINLPLILMVAVAVTGFIWLLDLCFLSSSRKQAVAGVTKQFEALSDDEKASNTGYLSAINEATKEPVFVEYAKSFFPVLAVVFVLRSFILEPFKIPSESMVPTLEVGDFIVVNKFAYGIRLPVFRTKIIDIYQPERGDVVVFFPPHEDRYFIKRLVGLPGDTIHSKDNVLYINGDPMSQEFVAEDSVVRRDQRACGGASYQIVKETIDGIEYLIRKCPLGSSLGRDEPWIVPEGHYFMMGDNRDNSADSRSPQWTKGAFVPDKNIVGKAFGIWMHWNKGLPSFSRTGSIK